MRICTLVLVGVAALLSLAVVAPAFAAGPQTGPATMQSITFETSSPSDTLQVFDYLDLFNTSVPATATWGPVAGVGVGGTKGFWVAGSKPAAYPTYPVGTRGEAELYIPDATHDYSSQIQFSYIEPSLGSNDRSATQQPFIVNWGASPTAGATTYSDFRLPLTSTWTTVTRTRGAMGNNPPRSAGYLRFQFVSDPNQAYGGAGARIDNIKVIGYKFGAPRNVVAERQSGNLATATISWDKPYGVDTPGTPDPRSIWYRVFRHDISAGTWTEVTTDATSATTLADPGAVIGRTYTYAVQGYDSATDASRWGLSASSPVVGPGYLHLAAISASAGSVAYGSAVTISATLLDPTDAPAAGQSANIVLERSFNGINYAPVSATIGEPTPANYAANVGVQTNTWYRFRYVANGTVGDAIKISSGTYLPTPSTPSRVTHRKKFTVKGSVSRAPLGTRSVKLRAYRRVNSRTWALKSTVVVKVGAGLGIAGYKATMKLSQKGTYRISATVSDGYSAGVTTGYRTFTVR